MERGGHMRGVRVLLISATILLSGTFARAATITNCMGAPVTTVNGKTVINLPGQDVIIRCALMALPGTDRVEVNAGSITIDGPNGGSVTATGKGLAINLQATGAITIKDANVTAANGNGDAVVQAGGNIQVTGGHLQAGAGFRVECTGAACTVNLNGVHAEANQLKIIGVGTVTITPGSVLKSHGPRDLIFIKSLTGDVLLGGGSLDPSQLCCEDLEKLCLPAPGPNCPLPLQLTQQNLVQVCNACEHPPVIITTGPEGSLVIMASQGKVDLTLVQAHVGTDITITALNNVIFTSANIDNCGPKRGKFTVTGATCIVSGATLRDDDPDTMPTLTCTVSGVPTFIGSCSSQP
jgi:hypothetical protein